MRIIAGIYKGKKINPVPGHTARPTSDYVREMIFSTLYSLGTKMDEVLDLYAGSGAMGLEALSRHARSITFVDRSRVAISTIISNIQLLNSKERCRVVQKNVSDFLIKKEKKFDLIIVDPPYEKSLVNSTIELLLTSDALTAGGTMVVEHSKKEPIDEKYEKYIIKVKQNGQTLISFLGKHQE
jgi:16S rRNA (guanine966-N2)-methyltransferase